MQTSTVIITNDFFTLTEKIARINICKFKFIEDAVFLLFDCDDKVFLTFFSNITISYRNSSLTSLKILVDVDKIPYSPFYIRLAHHGTSSQRPPLHFLPSSSGLSIVTALRLINSRK